MGQKGDKLTNNSVIAAEAFLEKLQSLENITSKKMFGGHGIFHDKKMFGIVNSKGQCFLKADDSNKSDFEKYGSEKHGRMPYYSIPDEVVGNEKTLVEWAKNSIEILNEK